MKELAVRFFRRAFLVAMCLLLGGLVLTIRIVDLRTAAADPPENQEYIGGRRCASCHFEQYASWKKTAHAKAFEVLTAKYQKNQKCLKCHTTGLGQPTGYVNQTKTAALAGVTCEVCHGPGSEHEKVGQKYSTIKTLTPEQAQELNGSIWRILPGNVCIECHRVQAHEEPATPPEFRTKQ
jgi:hypothetical protein